MEWCWSAVVPVSEQSGTRWRSLKVRPDLSLTLYCTSIRTHSTVTSVHSSPPAEDLTIDPEETPRFFRVTQGGKRIHYAPSKEDPEAETQKIFTLCKEKFSSGKHYWEVKVTDKTAKEKSWYVGVASETAERVYRIPLTPVNGFWVLCYEVERGVYIRDVPVPILLSHVGDELTTVGVFLDCDEHTLSFYNADTKSHLHTLTNLTLIPLRPLISPGIRDRTPIHIL